jgi:hypothetical protein
MLPPGNGGKSMGIQVNIRRRITVNGREYGSTGEMPADVREAYERAMAGGISIRSAKTRIVFNGREYAGLEAMPAETRQLYEKVLKAAESGTVPADLASGSACSGVSRAGATLSFDPSFSRKKAIVWIVLIAITLILYFLLAGK